MAKINLKLTLQPPVCCGGVFSQFIVMLPNALGFDIENIYFNNPKDERIPDGNPFNWVFDQREDLEYIEKDCTFHGSYTKKGLPGADIPGTNLFGNIEDGKPFRELKSIVKKVVIKPKLLSVVDSFCKDNINDKTFGVHVRTTDMNQVHPIYGVFTTEDYIRAIGEILKTEDISNIFVSADNTLSIHQIEKEFGNVVYFDSKIRPESHALWTSMNDSLYWEEIVIWCLILSRCNQLLCRVSNGSNAAILFSDTIKKIHRL